MNRYLKSVIGAIIGCAIAGGWLVVDLLTPGTCTETIYYIPLWLWSIWQLGGKLESYLENLGILAKAMFKSPGERTEAKFELKS